MTFREFDGAMQKVRRLAAGLCFIIFGSMSLLFFVAGVGWWTVFPALLTIYALWGMWAHTRTKYWWTGEG